MAPLPAGWLRRTMCPAKEKDGVRNPSLAPCAAHSRPWRSEEKGMRNGCGLGVCPCTHARLLSSRPGRLLKNEAGNVLWASLILMPLPPTALFSPFYGHLSLAYHSPSSPPLTDCKLLKVKGCLSFPPLMPRLGSGM